MVFRYFSSSSLTVPKARTTIGVIVVLTFHNFYTCYLKSWYLVICSSSFTFMFCSPGTAMAMILHSLFCLSVNTVSGLGCSISYLSGLQSPKVCYICRFPALDLVDARTICLEILSFSIWFNFLHRNQCIFFQVCHVSSCIGFQLWQIMNWQYGWHFQFCLCRAGIARTRPGDQCQFLFHFF